MKLYGAKKCGNDGVSFADENKQFDACHMGSFSTLAVHKFVQHKSFRPTIDSEPLDN